MKTVMSWLKAARLASQSYIALPLLLGQVIAWRITGDWDWTAFVLVQLYGFFDQLYIVFANDVADYEVDKLNDTYTPFSGGSRVLVDGGIERQTLAKAANTCALICMMIAVGLAILGSYAPLILIPFGLGLLWAYSYPPFALSYRGGGEFLQMIGVGFVLPMVGFTAQEPNFILFEWSVLPWFLVFQLACGITTTIPDAPSDKLGDKRTFAVSLGVRNAKILVIVLNTIAVGLLVGLGFDPRLAIAPVVSIVLTSIAAVYAQPGNRAVLAFVFFSVLTNLSATMGLIIMRFSQ